MEVTICYIRKDCQICLKQLGKPELVLNFGNFEKNTDCPVIGHRLAKAYSKFAYLVQDPQGQSVD